MASSYDIEMTDPGCRTYRDYFFGRPHENFVFFRSAVGAIVVSVLHEQLQERNESVWPTLRERVIIRSNEFDVRCSFVTQCKDFNIYGYSEGSENLASEVLSGSSLPDVHGLNQSELSASVMRLLEDISPKLDLAHYCKVIDPAVPAQLLRFDESELLLSQAVKFGVLYCQAGQQGSEKDMFSNKDGSATFTRFLSLLGDTVPLKNFGGFSGGLPLSVDNYPPLSSVYTKWRDIEIMFHVSTMMQFDPLDQQKIQRKRHIGNDIVTIIFIDEGEGQDLPFNPDTIVSHFLHIFIVVRVRNSKSPDKTSYSINIHTKRAANVPEFGPTGQEFAHSKDLREWMLTKLLNGQNAALRTPFFQKLSRRTRAQLFKELINGSAFGFKLKYDVFFPETNHTAHIVRPPRLTPVVDIVRALQLPKIKAVIVTIGGAGNMGPEIERKLTDFFSGGIAAAASSESGAIIITGGTKTGVMNLMGEGIDAVRRTKGASRVPTLLGVVANDKVYYPGRPRPCTENIAELEPNHSHFVLVDADDWGGETETMMGIANLLAWSTVRNEEATMPKAVTVLSNGGKVSLKEAWYSVQAGLPLVVMKGSGRLADEICHHVENKTPYNTVADSQLRDILRLGKIEVFPLGCSYKELRNIIAKQFKEKLRKKEGKEAAAQAVIPGAAENECNVQ